MLGRIYRIVNDVNDKVYIGQTVRTLKARFDRHCSSAKWAENSMAIKAAILKYGKEHFRIELIEECEREFLDEREVYWISFYDSYKHGYNRTKGGQSVGYKGKLTEENKQEVIEMYKNGISPLKIASLYKVSRTTIQSLLRSKNIPIYKALANMVDIEEVKEYIRQNRPYISDVAKKFGISISSVRNIIKNANDDTLLLNSFNPRKSNAVKHAKEICDKYQEGYNIQDLIKLFHSPKRYISKVLKANGITIQRGRKALIEYNNSKSVQTPPLY